MSLDKFFNPKSIAIIGASNNKKKLGFQILNNLKNDRFRGKIYPINLHDKKINELKAFSDITDLKNKIDLAVIVIPASFVLDEIKKCAVANIKNIIIISAGFSEAGGAGKEIEDEIKRIGIKNNLNILGPNCLGVISSWQKINTTFASAKIKPGRVAFLSQSGAVGSAVLDWLQDKEIGLSYFVSLGNKAVMDENNFLDFLARDKNTDLIIAYLEEIQNGQDFMRLASRVSRIKPIVVLKSGQSKSGQAAALSHTGSLAGSNEAIHAGFRRAGIIEINSLEEAFTLMKINWTQKVKADENIFIISNAGGPMVMTVDLCEKYNLSIGQYSAETEKRLKNKLGQINLYKNPLDIIGDASALRYRKALEIVLDDKKVNNLLVLLTPQTSTQIEETARIIVKMSKKYKNKLICASFIGGESVAAAKNILDKNNIPNFDYPNKAIIALAQYIKQNLIKTKIKPYNYEAQSKTVLTPFQIEKNHQGEQLDYLESFKLLKKYNIPVSLTKKIITNKDLKKLKYPIALKVVGKNLIHKTDKESVRLNLNNQKEASQALKSFSLLLKDKDNYAVAQKMGKGMEIILGFRRDDSFGPIIMVGAGGIYAEILGDIQTEVGDIDYARALEMIKRLKIYKILVGARGQKALDIRSLAKAVVNIANLARENKGIEELDINPLFITDKGVEAVDVRIIV